MTTLTHRTPCRHPRDIPETSQRHLRRRITARRYRLHHRWAHPRAQHLTCFAAANSFLSQLAVVAGSDRSLGALNLATGQQVRGNGEVTVCNDV